MLPPVQRGRVGGGVRRVLFHTEGSSGRGGAILVGEMSCAGVKLGSNSRVSIGYSDVVGCC